MKRNTRMSTAQAAIWNILGGGGETVIRLGATTVLARILGPEDFGIFGIGILLYSMISQVSLGGVAAGLIAKQKIQEKDINTCFWMITVGQLILFAIAFAMAPLGAEFFHTARIIAVLRVISLSFLFTMVGTIPLSLLKRQLRFGTIAVISCLSVLVGSLATIILAWVLDLRYWALVVGTLITGLIENFAALICGRWVPKLQFSKQSFRYLFRYGANGLGSSLANYFHQNVDYILVGKLLGATSLGLYQFAYKIPHMIQQQIARPMGSVVFPALSRIQSSNERFSSGYIRAVRYIALISLPALGGLAILADLIIRVLWGEKWLSAVTPFRILCMCAAIRCIMQPIGSLFYCKDRPDIIFKFGVARLFFTVGIVAFLGYVYGLNGIAAGMVISTFPSFWILSLGLKMTRSSLLKFFSALSVPLTGAVLSMSCAYVTRCGLELIGIPVWSILCLSILGGAIGYVLCLYLFFRETWKEALDTVLVIVGHKTLKDKDVAVQTTVT